MTTTFENGLPIDVISQILFEVDPVSLKQFDVHADEYLWEAELLQSVPLPITAEDVYMVFDSMFNRISDTDGIVHTTDIIAFGDWCEHIAQTLNGIHDQKLNS